MIGGLLICLVVALALTFGALVYRAEQDSIRAGDRHFGGV